MRNIEFLMYNPAEHLCNAEVTFSSKELGQDIFKVELQMPRRRENEPLVEYKERIKVRIMKECPRHVQLNFISLRWRSPMYHHGYFEFTVTGEEK